MSSKGFSKEQWRVIYELAEALLTIPHQDRSHFLDSKGTDPEIALEVLDLAEQLENDDEAETPSRAGSRVGRFELIEFLGAGGAGDVFSARDPELRRTVAIKILRSPQTELPDANERFIREARTASTLNHPNIVTVHEIIRTEPHLAIVMELVQGECVRKVSGQAMSAARLIPIAQQVAEALAAAHAAGIIHRDIKPENLMVTAGDRVKVLDFGLARLMSSDTVTAPGLAAGTLRYMSPEHYHGATLTPKSDVFALGLVLYELATGKHPFGQASSLEILHLIATEEIPPPQTVDPAVPQRLSDLIVRMLSKVPDQRPQAREVALALRTMLSEKQPVETAGSVIATNRWSGWGWYALGGILVVAVLAAGMYASKLSTARTSITVERLTSQISENSVTAAAISPDGRHYAYAIPDGVILQRIGNQESNQLKSPQGFVVDHLSWMPDGTRLIASGFSELTSQPALWWLSINGGEARLLREDARWGMSSPDGQRISFLSSDYLSLWTMGANGEDARRVVEGEPADSYRFAFWAANNRHLIAYRRRGPVAGNKTEASVLAFDSVDSASGARVDTTEHIGVYAATAMRDGEIVFMTGPNLTDEGEPVAGSLKMNLATGRFAGKPALLHESRSLPTGNCAELSATADGKRLAVVGRSVSEPIFVADFDRDTVRLANVRRLTLEDGGNYPHGWTGDSQSVIFESDRLGHGFGIFKQSLSKRISEGLTATPGQDDYLPQLTPDGKSILFTSASQKNRSATSLRRISVGGGDGRDIPTSGSLDEFRCGTGPASRCILRKTLGTNEYVFYDLDPARGIGAELARVPWSPNVLGDWNISPDGMAIAIPNHDLHSATVRVVHLDTKGKQATINEVAIPNLTRLSMVTWTADGKGWFVVIDTSVGRRTYFWDLRTNPQPLGIIRGWVVPAPDNRKIAFLNRIDPGNVWLISR